MAAGQRASGAANNDTRASTLPSCSPVLASPSRYLGPTVGPPVISPAELARGAGKALGYLALWKLTATIILILTAFGTDAARLVDDDAGGCFGQPIATIH